MYESEELLRVYLVGNPRLRKAKLLKGRNCEARVPRPYLGYLSDWSSQLAIHSYTWQTAPVKWTPSSGQR